MKKCLVLGLALAGLSSLLALPALAHGVGYREAGGLSPVALEFFYSTGEPMSYREAKVFSPADEKFAHQTGRTDAAGRFAFVPDVPGLWRVVVRDEEGPQATAELDVTEALLKGGSVKSEATSVPPADSNNPPEGLDLLIRAALGVSLLFNLAAFILLIRLRGKRPPETPGSHSESGEA